MAIKLDFKQSSWEKVKPKDLKKDNLSAALKDVEKNMGNDKKLAACVAAMRQAASAAQDLMKGDCNPKKDKELHAALKKLVSDSEAEIKRLQAALEESESGEDEDEDGDDLNKLLNVEKFSIFLKKAKGADNADGGTGFVFCFHKLEGAKCHLVLEMPAKVNARYTKLKSKLPKIDSDYKKRNIVCGKAYRDDKYLVLECLPGEEPPEVPGMEKKIKMWVKAHKGDITPMKKVRFNIPGMGMIDIDVDDESEGAESETQENVAATEVPPQAPPTAGPTATASTVPPQAPPTPANGAPVDAAAMEDRRKEFRKARQAWQSAKEKAMQDLEAVKDGIRDYYLDDPEMFKLATSKLGQLDAIMDNIGDDLRDILDKYVSTPKSRQDQLQQLAGQARATVEQFLNYVANDRLLNAVDNEQEMGLAEMKIRDPLQRTLKALVNSLG